MDVEQILSTKGRAVVTIESGSTLADAAHLLAEKRIGAVVVSDADHVVLGILSERDIVRAVAAAGASALGSPVSRYMTAEVVTCSGHAAVHELMETMTRRRFRHVPIVEGGQLRGMVSIGDLVKHRLAEMEAESQAMREYIATA